jgi:hypothetical protein
MLRILLLFLECFQLVRMQTLTRTKYKYHNDKTVSQSFKNANFMGTSITKTRVQCLSLCNLNDDCSLVNIGKGNIDQTCDLYSTSDNWTNNQVYQEQSGIFVKTCKQFFSRFKNRMYRYFFQLINI